jgi:hypothetical protein
LKKVQWAPYEKWFEARFQTLSTAAELSGPLDSTMDARHWRDREDGLVGGAEVLLGVQRERGLPTPARGVIDFWDRPYRTVADAVPRALLADVSEQRLARLPLGIGSIEQWVDNVDVLSRPDRRGALTAAYRLWAGTG